MTRSLPKPITYGFFAILALSVIIPLGWKACKASQSAGTGTSTQLGQTGSGQATISSDELSHWGESVTLVELEDALRRDSSLVQQKDSEQWTVLHFSAAALRADLIPILIEHGADPNALNAEGQTPLHVVLFMEANAEYLADRLGQQPGDYELALRALLENGADPNAFQTGSAEGSAIAWAEANGLTGSAAVLAEYGGDTASSPPAYPSITISKGDELFPTWNALSAAGFQEISTTGDGKGDKYINLLGGWPWHRGATPRMGGRVKRVLWCCG